jgi:hypothetical protein
MIAPEPQPAKATATMTLGDVVAGDAATNVGEPVPAAASQPSPVRTPEDRTCEVCGNQYDKTIRVVVGGRSHVFDCFECAIHALAPKCAHCGCRIVGHGMESDGVMYCCAHCAHVHGVGNLQDRADVAGA